MNYEILTMIIKSKNYNYRVEFLDRDKCVKIWLTFGINSVDVFFYEDGFVFDTGIGRYNSCHEHEINSFIDEMFQLQRTIEVNSKIISDFILERLK